MESSESSYPACRTESGFSDVEVSGNRVSHGGDWRGFVDRRGELPLDFSANLSPLGMPRQVKDAVAVSIERCECYPDPLNRDLKEAIGYRLHVPSSWVYPGAGVADLIYRCVYGLRPKHALILAPTFSEYERALTAAQCVTDSYLLSSDAGFMLDEVFLEALDEAFDLVILCEPNNPSGVLTPRPLLHAILKRCAHCGATLVIDESFIDFTDDPSGNSAVTWVASHPELVLLRSFTKLYAMAGLRLGYAVCSNTRLIHGIELAGPPWNIATPAQVAGIAALKATEYEEDVRALIATERPRLADALKALDLHVVEGTANYLLFQGPCGLTPALEARGMLIRSCATYEGLDESWYRVAVRTCEENARLIAAFKEALS